MGSPSLALHVLCNYSTRIQGPVSNGQRTSCKQRVLWVKRCTEFKSIPTSNCSWHGLLPEMMLLPSLMISMAWQVTFSGTTIRRSSLCSGVYHTRISFLEQVANKSEDSLKDSEKRDNEERLMENTSFFVRSKTVLQSFAVSNM